MYEIFVDGLSIGTEELSLEEVHMLDRQEGILLKRIG